jgi:Flp pilus assembly CpaE family ATPase
VLAVRRARWIAKILQRLGWSHEKVEILVNRYREASDLDLNYLQTLFQPLAVSTVPADRALVSRATVLGAPLHTVAPFEALTLRFESIAARLAGRPEDSRPVRRHKTDALSWIFFWRQW